jgi:hypothetical protein
MADTMTEAVTRSRTDLPRYLIVEFGNPTSVQDWINDRPEYELVSLTPISVTNHFSKETETTVWVTGRLREDLR